MKSTCIHYRLAVTASVDKLMVYMDVMEPQLDVPPPAEETAPRHVEEHGETLSMTSEVQISRSLTDTKDKKLNDICYIQHCFFCRFSIKIGFHQQRKRWDLWNIRLLMIIYVQTYRH